MHATLSIQSDQGQHTGPNYYSHYNIPTRVVIGVGVLPPIALADSYLCYGSLLTSCAYHPCFDRCEDGLEVGGVCLHWHFIAVVVQIV